MEKYDDLLYTDILLLSNKSELPYATVGLNLSSKRSQTEKRPYYTIPFILSSRHGKTNLR